MTICIAGITENDKIVAITDKMLTLSTSPVTKYEFNENNKAIQLSDKIVGLFSGDVIIANEILNLAKIKINPATDTVEQVANHVNDAFKEYWQSTIENFLQMRYMIGLAYFMQNQSNLDAGLVKQVTELLMKYTIEVEFLVAGVDTAPHIFQINNLGTVINRGATGYGCIGSGSQHATLSLIESQYNAGIRLERSLYALLEAKKRAEFDPGVGQLCDIVIINGGYKQLNNTQITKVMKLHQLSLADIEKITEACSKEILKEV